MSDWIWVIGAYALTWIVLGVYAILLHRRLGVARAQKDREMHRIDTPKGTNS